MTIPVSKAPEAPSAGAHMLTGSGSHPLAVRRAAGFFGRFRGLMLRPGLAPDAGLLLADCPSVHTAFMRFTIDVLYLDRQGTVLKCVPGLRPWRASVSNTGRAADGRRHVRAMHTLELAEGSIARLGIRPGDRLQHPLWFASPVSPVPAPAPVGAPLRKPPMRQRGAAVVELAVVGPLLTMLGLGSVQYSQLFFAKNTLDHAGFLAARAGSVGNAKMTAIGSAFKEGLIPMFGGGETPAELADALVKVEKALEDPERPNRYRIEMLNPTKEAFQDFNDPALQALLKTQGKRVISNRSLGLKQNKMGPTSGQSWQDANLIKLRITYGVEPAVPIVSSIYKAYLKWQDTGGDAVRTAMINQGWVPVVTHVTMQMQSDAIEPDNPVSSPGPGNNGNPSDPGDPPVTTDPPPNGDCMLGGCTTTPPSTPGTCPIPIAAELSADMLFGFDQTALTSDGKAALDQLIQSTNGKEYGKLTVTGYTDPIGTEEYNLDLSRRRAEAVRDYLISKGLKVDDVEIVGAGEADLVVPEEACTGKTGAALQTCLAPNRRVTVELTPK
ncbi:OmpA family protein [Massilia dura]|uniref:OmpA family protein n=1 Tax=Pseudoduganella dura TaxID=321982 RepID=A0A6I3XST6_9BURK|nr:OmpA family protein [Pseudoduganella dura]MUI16362.1 OmpA family protein [Pseudoduganella dura]GGX86241.1 hypothetical protein GCM10007386_16300 [Pseudoduganella dura]